mgnify:FL=1
MAYLMSAKEICERALRKAGPYSINDTAADPEHLRESLFWLDTIMAHLSGQTTIWWLVQQIIQVPLTAGDGSYDLLDTMGASAPTDGFLFPLYARLYDGTDNRSAVDIVTRDKIDSVVDPTTTGRPNMIHIDRDTPNPTMLVYPVLSTGLTGYKIELTVQTFSPTVAPAGVTGRAGQGNMATGLRQTWQLWAITRLAASIADGPVCRRPQTDIKSWHAIADKLEAQLLAFDNRQHESTPPITEYPDDGIS